MSDPAPKNRCPVCALDADVCPPTEALALGLALGVALQNMHDVTELVCDEHRVRWSMAMFLAAQKIK
jgi:hypothetical protein